MAHSPQTTQQSKLCSVLNKLLNQLCSLQLSRQLTTQYGRIKAFLPQNHILFKFNEKGKGSICTLTNESLAKKAEIQLKIKIKFQGMHCYVLISKGKTRRGNMIWRTPLALLVLSCIHVHYCSLPTSELHSFIRQRDSAWFGGYAVVQEYLRI